MGTLTINNAACNITPANVKYGILYNWFTISDIRGIAKTGWRVPTSSDFSTLTSFLGGSSVAGGKLKETGLVYWQTPNTGATNESNMNFRGSGTRISGSFSSYNQSMVLWFNWESGANAVYATASYNGIGFPSGATSYKQNGYSLRLIKESTSLSNGQTGTYVGNDLKLYNSICVGTQEWLSENLAETKYNNLDLIPEVQNGTTWQALTTGARCYYNNDPTNM